MFSMLKANSEDVSVVAPQTFIPSIDMAALAGYEDLQIDGEPDLIVELIDLYVEDAPRRMAAIRDSLAGRDWLSVKREAHSLRGSSGNLGALRMARICDEIEGIQFVELWPGVEALLRCLQLEAELKRVIQLFLAERQRRLR
jgi:HPt (histidine-containing phosphotransfer) domain-containing protein